MFQRMNWLNINFQKMELQYLAQIKKQISIRNLEGIKKAERLQARGWTALYNGFFNESVTMVKGTEQEIKEYRINRFK